MSATVALTLSSSRAYLRDKSSLFFTFAFPLVFLVLFGAIYARPAARASSPTSSTSQAGVLAWGVANAAVFGTAFTLMQWRRDDLLRLIRLTPARLVSVLASRMLVTLAIAACQVGLFVAVAMLPFFGLRPSADAAAARCLCSSPVSPRSSRSARSSVASPTRPSPPPRSSNLLMVPMAFLSGSFIPLQSMPDVVQQLSRALPLRYLTDAARAALSGEDALSTVAVSSLVLLGFAVLGSLVLLRVFRWSVRP